jgi:hypothetical protein
MYYAKGLKNSNVEHIGLPYLSWPELTWAKLRDSNMDNQ